MAKSTTKTTGVDKVLRKIRVMSRTPSLGARVGTKATSGTLRRIRGPNKTESRTAGKNTIIMRSHAKSHAVLSFDDDGKPLPTTARAPARKINFISSEESVVINKIWSAGVKRYMQTAGLNHLITAGNNVGKMVVIFWKGHIDKSQGPKGALKKLPETTIKRKRREGSTTPTKPMRNTGQLRSSFVHSLKVYR